MKVMFNGLVEKRVKGCKPCGKASTETGFTTVKAFLLPSGVTKTFRKGRAEDVSDDDAAFLLQYKAFVRV